MEADAASLNLPPEVMQMIQQSGISGGELTQLVQQLQQMSPEEIQQVLDQYGIQASPDDVEQLLNQASGTPPTGEQEDEVAAPDDDTA